jgi:hypothetical protein
MFFVIVFAAFIALDVAALVWGVDSRPSKDWHSRQD